MTLYINCLIFFFASNFFSPHAVAAALPAEWADLHWGQDFLLDQELKFPEGPVLPDLTSFSFSYQVGLPEIQSVMIEMSASQCLTPEATSEGELFLPKNSGLNGRDARVWVELLNDCILNIYVEAADYYSPSFFVATLPPSGPSL